MGGTPRAINGRGGAETGSNSDRTAQWGDSAVTIMKKSWHHSLSTQIRPASVAVRHRASKHCCGFSLTELLVVLVVTTILTGLLLPAMSSLRENVNRVVCSSNQRQIGVGFSMYLDDHHERFPSSVHLDDRDGHWMPHELMAVHHGETIDGWDGLGLLFKGGYCAAPQCFYCPSHRGEHPVERYLGMWNRPGGQPIYSNYHYAGHRHWSTGNPRTWRNADRLVVATDGLRTTSDFNHGNGMNVLYGDASVRWSGAAASILPLLPTESKEMGPPDEDYFSIWDNLQGPPVSFE